MKITALFASLAVAGAAMAATGTKTVTGLVPSGLDLASLTGAASGGVTFPVSTSGTALSFDALGMVDVPDDAILVGVTYEFVGKIWVDWSVTSGTAPKAFGDGTLTADGPGGGSSVGIFSYLLPVTTGSSGTVTKSPIPGALVNVAGGDFGLFDKAVSASSTVSFSLTGSGDFGLVGTSSIDGSQLPYAGVEVTVSYNWQTPEVPEASTYAAAFGLVGLVGFGWVRSRR